MPLKRKLNGSTHSGRSAGGVVVRPFAVSWNYLSWITGSPA